jgi:HD-like signal output (HDOD) protein
LLIGHEVDSDTLSVDEIAELLAASRPSSGARSRPPPARSLAPGADVPPTPASSEPEVCEEALSAAEIAAMLAGAAAPSAEPEVSEEALSAAEIAAMLAGAAAPSAEPEVSEEALSAAEIAAMLAGATAPSAEPEVSEEALSAAEIAAMLAGAAAPSAEPATTSDVTELSARSEVAGAPRALSDAGSNASELARGEPGAESTQTIELDAVDAVESALQRPALPPRPPPRSLPPVDRDSLPPALPPLASLALQPLSAPPAPREPAPREPEVGPAPVHLAAGSRPSDGPRSTPPATMDTKPSSPVTSIATPATPAAPVAPVSPAAPVAPVSPAAPRPPPAGSMDLEALISATPHDLSRKLYRSDAIGRIVATLRMLGRECSGRPEGDRKFVAALLRAVTNDGLELPVMPKLVLDIQRVLDSPTADLGGVIGSIEQEPMVSTKVIGIASSAAYRAVAPPRSVREAVFRIGMAETRNVVLAILSHSKLFRVPGHEKRALELGRRAIGAAAAASRIARAARVDVDQAFLAGMTHDIGSVALLNVAAELHRSSRGRVAVTPRMLTEVEHAVHADLSALVAETWSFPAVLVAAFGCHHAPTEAPPEAQRLTQLLALSDAIVLHLVDGRNHGIPTEHPAALALGFRELRDLVGDVRRSFDSLCSAAAPTSSVGLRAGHGR